LKLYICETYIVINEVHCEHNELYRKYTKLVKIQYQPAGVGLLLLACIDTSCDSGTSTLET